MTTDKFARQILVLCFAHGASVTSWIRTRKRNAAVGGAARSYHLDGLAADLVLDDPANKPALLLGARAHGLRAIDEGDHIHVQATSRK